MVFPGSNCEQDVVTAARYLGAEAGYIWHDSTDLSGYDAVVLPGGFSYGDYLRTGAIAARSKVMKSVKEFADAGGPVLGICNGFQILCESGLLPGAMRPNRGLKFICRTVRLRLETADSPFTSQGERGRVLEVPINHFEGNYQVSAADLDELTAQDRVAFRYCSPAGEITDVDNPNGAVDAIAGVLSEGRNILGMMPHPERATDPEVGGVDGAVIFSSLMKVGQAA